MRLGAFFCFYVGWRRFLFTRSTVHALSGLACSAHRRGFPRETSSDRLVLASALGACPGFGFQR